MGYTAPGKQKNNHCHNHENIFVHFFSFVLFHSFISFDLFIKILFFSGTFIKLWQWVGADYFEIKKY